MSVATEESDSNSDYFKSLYPLDDYDIESPHYYADGTLFPVHIGDLFQPQDEDKTSASYRYKVMLKIGHGSYSTVWLAVDLQTE
jgi:hypothetical protein